MFNQSMWIIRSTRIDSLVERPPQHQLLSVELICPWGVLHTFQSATELGCLKTEFIPSSQPGIIPYNPVWALLLKVWLHVGNTSSTRELVGNADPRALPQTYWTHTCILTRSPADSCILTFGKHKPVCPQPCMRRRDCLISHKYLTLAVERVEVGMGRRGNDSQDSDQNSKDMHLRASLSLLLGLAAQPGSAV